MCRECVSHPSYTLSMVYTWYIARQKYVLEFMRTTHTNVRTDSIVTSFRQKVINVGTGTNIKFEIFQSYLTWGHYVILMDLLILIRHGIIVIEFLCIYHGRITSLTFPLQYNASLHVLGKTKYMYRRCPTSPSQYIRQYIAMYNDNTFHLPVTVSMRNYLDPLCVLTISLTIL